MVAGCGRTFPAIEFDRANYEVQDGAPRSVSSVPANRIADLKKLLSSAVYEAGLPAGEDAGFIRIVGKGNDVTYRLESYTDADTILVGLNGERWRLDRADLRRFTDVCGDESYEQGRVH